MAFSPPFCPHDDCLCHQDPPPTRWWHRRGHYTSHLKGQIPRFTCAICGRSFSSQSFSLDYWTKKKVDIKRIFYSLISASGLRDMAREQGVSDKMIANCIMRRAHQVVILSTRLRSSRKVGEDIAIDGFESFVYYSVPFFLDLFQFQKLSLIQIAVCSLAGLITIVWFEIYKVLKGKKL